MSKRYRAAMMGVLAAVFSMGMLLQVPAAEADQTEKTQEETEGEQVLIGEKAGDSDYEVTLVNESGKEISEIALRISYGEFTGNLLPEGTVLADAQQGIMWCTPAEMVNYIPPVYDMKVTFADGTDAVLHTLPFGDAKEITIKQEDASGICFLRFFSISMNTETDSLTREENIEKSGEKVLIADYQAKISQSSSGFSGDSASGAPSQEAAPQQCLEDGLVF